MNIMANKISELLKECGYLLAAKDIKKNYSLRAANTYLNWCKREMIMRAELANPSLIPKITKKFEDLKKSLTKTDGLHYEH